MIMRGVAVQDCTHVRKTGGQNARVTTSIGGGGRHLGARGCRPASGWPSFSQRRCGQGRAQPVVITAQPETECGQLSRMEHHGHSSGKSPPCPVEEAVTMTALFVHLRPHWCTNTCTCKGRQPGWFCECVCRCVCGCALTTSSKLTLAPLLMSSCTISRLPCSAATIRGVCPFWNTGRESGGEKGREWDHSHTVTHAAPHWQSH